MHSECEYVVLAHNLMSRNSAKAEHEIATAVVPAEDWPAEDSDRNSRSARQRLAKKFFSSTITIAGCPRPCDRPAGKQNKWLQTCCT